jgi:pyruvate formate lyase activating enzyme
MNKPAMLIQSTPSLPPAASACKGAKGGDGIVFDIQRAAMNDGPGIRTTVFLKGCPLRCVWCHNPESWTLAPQIAVNGTGKQYGKRMSVGEVMAVVLRDIAFYQTSGGGLTISGGEPTMQADFCLALLRAAKQAGIHTCLDTSGMYSSATLEKLLPWVDLYLFDVKATDEQRHQQLTGMPLAPIQKTLNTLNAAGANIWLRCPIVPQLNDTEHHLRAIAALSRDNANISKVCLMPYHKTGLGKWRDIGIESSTQHIEEPDDASKRRWVDLLLSEGARHVEV